MWWICFSALQAHIFDAVRKTKIPNNNKQIHLNNTLTLAPFTLDIINEYIENL